MRAAAIAPSYGREKAFRRVTTGGPVRTLSAMKRDSLAHASDGGKEAGDPEPEFAVQSWRS